MRYSLEALTQPGPVIDPLVLDKAVDRYRRGKRTLEITAQHYRVALDDAHDAGADAIAAGRVAQALATAFPAELDLDPRELHTRQAGWFAEQAASFEEYMRRVKDPSFVAARGWPVR